MRYKSAMVLNTLRNQCSVNARAAVYRYNKHIFCVGSAFYFCLVLLIQNCSQVIFRVTKMKFRGCDNWLNCIFKQQFCVQTALSGARRDRSSTGHDERLSNRSSSTLEADVYLLYRADKTLQHSRESLQTKPANQTLVTPPVKFNRRSGDLDIQIARSVDWY